MKKHVKLSIRGKVQGVWYRGSAQRKARELGLHGYVRNQPDGSVYAEAEGPEEQIDEWVRWCRVGPELARVEQLEVVEGECQGYDSFVISR